LIADQGIITAGAVDVVRSAQAEREELLFILADSGSTALVVEDRKTLKNCEIASTPCRFIWWSCSRMKSQRQTKPKGAELSDSDGSWFKPASTAGKSEPGYTGDFDIHVWNLWQRRESWQLVTCKHTFGAVFGAVQPQQAIASSCPPSWHAYERTCEYFILSQGCTQIYTNIRNVKRDLQEFKPQIMVGVPRLWE